MSYEENRRKLAEAIARARPVQAAPPPAPAYRSGGIPGGAAHLAQDVLAQVAPPRDYQARQRVGQTWEARGRENVERARGNLPAGSLGFVEPVIAFANDPERPSFSSMMEGIGRLSMESPWLRERYGREDVDPLEADRLAAVADPRYLGEAEETVITAPRPRGFHDALRTVVATPERAGRPEMAALARPFQDVGDVVSNIWRTPGQAYEADNATRMGMEAQAALSDDPFYEAEAERAAGRQGQNVAMSGVELTPAGLAADVFSGIRAPVMRGLARTAAPRPVRPAPVRLQEAPEVAPPAPREPIDIDFTEVRAPSVEPRFQMAVRDPETGEVYSVARNADGVHLGTTPDQANTVNTTGRIERNRTGMDYVEGARNMPVYARVSNPLRMEDPTNWGTNEILSQIAWNEPPINIPKPSYDVTPADIRDAIRGAGYDSIVYRNAHEGAGDSYIVLPDADGQVRNIRSIFAAFDPAKRDSSDLLASVAPAALTAGGAGTAAALMLPDEAFAGEGEENADAFPWAEIGAAALGGAAPFLGRYRRGGARQALTTEESVARGRSAPEARTNRETWSWDDVEGLTPEERAVAQARQAQRMERENGVANPRPPGFQPLQRDYEPRDLVMGYNDGMSDEAMGIEFGLDPERIDIGGRIATELTRVRGRVRKVIAEEGDEGLARLSAEWRLTPDELQRFVAMRTGMGQREFSWIAEIRRIIDEGITDNAAIRREVANRAPALGREPPDPNVLGATISKARRDAGLTRGTTVSSDFNMSEEVRAAMASGLTVPADIVAHVQARASEAGKGRLNLAALRNMISRQLRNARSRGDADLSWLGAVAVPAAAGGMVLGADEASAEEGVPEGAIVEDGLILDPNAPVPSMNARTSAPPMVSGDIFIEEFADGSRYAFRMRRDGSGQGEPERLGLVLGSTNSDMTQNYGRRGYDSGEPFEGVTPNADPLDDMVTVRGEPRDPLVRRDSALDALIEPLGLGAGLIAGLATRGRVRPATSYAIGAGTGAAVSGGSEYLNTGDAESALRSAALAAAGATLARGGIDLAGLEAAPYLRRTEALAADPNHALRAEAFAQTLPQMPRPVRTYYPSGSRPEGLTIRNSEADALPSTVRGIGLTEAREQGYALDLPGDMPSPRQEFLEAPEDVQREWMDRVSFPSPTTPEGRLAARAAIVGPHDPLRYATTRAQVDPEIFGQIEAPTGRASLFTEPNTGRSVFGAPARAPAAAQTLEERVAKAALRGVDAATLRRIATDLDLDVRGGQLRQRLVTALGQLNPPGGLETFLKNYGVTGVGGGILTGAMLSAEDEAWLRQ